MRLAPLLALVLLGTLLPHQASARTIRVLCDDRTANRCDNAGEPRVYDVERGGAVERQGRSHRRTDPAPTGAGGAAEKQVPVNSAAAPTPDTGTKADESGSTRGADSNNTDAKTAAAPTKLASQTAPAEPISVPGRARSDTFAADPAGLGAWSTVLFIVIAGAGVLSLMLAKAADA